MWRVKMRRVSTRVEDKVLTFFCSLVSGVVHIGVVIQCSVWISGVVIRVRYFVHLVPVIVLDSAFLIVVSV